MEIHCDFDGIYEGAALLLHIGRHELQRLRSDFIWRRFHDRGTSTMKCSLWAFAAGANHESGRNWLIEGAMTMDYGA